MKRQPEAAGSFINVVIKGSMPRKDKLPPSYELRQVVRTGFVSLLFVKVIGNQETAQPWARLIESD